MRMNNLLIYASGHTYTETFEKALTFGVSSTTAKRYMDELVSFLAKHKPITNSVEI